MHRMAEEYVRSCAFTDRQDLSRYFVCQDFIHTGHVVWDRGMQILLNGLCNPYLFNNSHTSS